MKISASEEYGLRILLQIARAPGDDGLTIAQISELENISPAYAAKLSRQLRLAGFIQSIRGQRGGYVLAQPAEKIQIGQLLHAMGGAMFDEKFCHQHTGMHSLCTNSVDCSLRSLWTILQLNLDRLLEQITLGDLLQPETQVNSNLITLSQNVMA